VSQTAAAPAAVASGASRRFLVLSAAMGSGHDAVARELVSRLTSAGHHAISLDVLDLLPAGAGRGLRSCYHAVISHLPGLYAGIYAAFFRDGVLPRPNSDPLAALAGGRLLAFAACAKADVVVSVFHLAAQVTGRLRARGALGVPSAVVMTEFAPHRQWLHPGNDLYLCHAGEVAAEIAAALNRPAVASGPLVARRFTEPPAPREAEHWRRRLAAPGRPAVLLSTGAWGIGTRLAKTAGVLDAAGYLPVVLCGENTRLRRALSASRRAVALGWVDDMPALMAAARVLVDNAAGQTAAEALAAGLPVIGYRPIPGHGADGVRKMAALGLSDHVHDAPGLLRSVRTLSAPGPARDRRIAAGRAVFAAGGISSLETLGVTPGAATARMTGH